MTDFLWRELTPIILFIELDKSVTEGTKADPLKPVYINNIHSGKSYYVLVLIFFNWIFHLDLDLDLRIGRQKFGLYI